MRMSAWRANDVVTYDVMRESATTLTALLHRVIVLNPRVGDRIRSEIAAWRDDVVTVNAYDRADVVALATRIEARSREINGETS